MTRQEYELSDEDYKALIFAIRDAQSQPVMMIGGSGPRSVQDVANEQWARIGVLRGFDGSTVEPVGGKGERFFTALPVKRPIPGRGRINLVFESPPGPDGARFIEAEDAYGASIRVGEWRQEGDRWLLVIP